MKNISLSQKKIILILGIVAAVFLLFCFFIYYPAKNTVSRIKQELSGIENQIQGIELIISNAKTMGEGIKLLEQRYQQLNSKFPQKEEESLRALSDLAPVSNIDIISIRPETKAVFIGANNQKVEIDGKVCQKVFVSIEMNGAYQDLVKYLENLKKSLPVFIGIERLKISKGAKETPKLDIALDISFYLLS